MYYAPRKAISFVSVFWVYWDIKYRDCDSVFAWVLTETAASIGWIFYWISQDVFDRRRNIIITNNPDRFAAGELVDAIVTTVDKAARKVNLSIKAREVQEEKITHNEPKRREIRSDLNFKIKIIGELKSKD
mgnify:CR=1 FL=1